MTRYFTRASAIVANPQDREPFSLYSLGEIPAATQVFESEARNTGLLDADGQAIWASERAPLGFQTKGQDQ